MKNRFFKGHGLGNEYIVLDPAELTFLLTPSRIARICDREKGIGSDGVLTLEDSGSADFGVRIWNPDGSEAETSGNGLRIFACYLHATGRTRKKSFTVETVGGTVRVETQHDHRGAEDEVGTVCGASVQMGRATFSPEALPCTLEVDELVERGTTAGGELVERGSSARGELVERPIHVAGETLTFTGVSVGNPHCVVFHPRVRKCSRDDLRGRRENLLRGSEDQLWRRDDLVLRDARHWSRDDLLRLGPTLETHPIFPQRTNVQLAEPTGPDSIRILIWERGAGETPSSGSSACAAASAAVRLGLVRSPVAVESPGGTLLVDVDEKFDLTLTGPVAEMARGTFGAEMLRGILDADQKLQTT